MHLYQKFFLHLRTIVKHKRLVLSCCWRAGLYWQGLWHDMSKFSPVEFFPGVKYYQGDRSPNDMQRITKGYSAAWLNHKGRNRHHLEYWIDYNPEQYGQYSGLKMPLNYLIESVCDRIAASKVYNGNFYTDQDALNYYLRSKIAYLVHDDTDRKFMEYLEALAQKGEEQAFQQMRHDLRASKNYLDY